MRQTCTVVVIEDSPEDREQIRRYLAHDPLCDYTLLEAVNGKQGIELWQAEQAGCILIDYNLPDMSGLEILQEIAPRNDSIVAIIMLTGQGSESVAATAMQKGVQDYLVKNTLTAEKLQSAVRAAIEHTRIQNMLKENQALVQAVIDNSAAAIYVRDSEARYLLTNREYERLFGLDRNMVKGETGHDFFSADIVARWLANDRVVLESGKAAEFEEIVPQTDGIRTYISVKFPLYTVHGTLYGVCGILTDITERKRFEEALYQSKQEFQTLVENSPDIIARFDRQYRHLYINSAITQSTGHLPDYFLGKTNRDLNMPDAYCQLWDSSLEAVFSTGKEKIIEFSSPALDELRYYQARLVPEYDMHGNVATVLDVTHDVSDLWRAEYRLRFLAALNNTISASLDVQTICDSAVQCIVSSVADLCSIHILEENGSIRRTAADGADEDNRAVLQNMLSYESPLLENSEAALNVDQSHASDLLFEHVHGTSFRAYMKLPLVARQQTIGVLDVALNRSNRQYTTDDVIMMKDVAWRIATALDNARLYQTAQQAVKDRDTFLSVAAHELRTPLTALHGFVQLLKRRLSKQGTIEPAQLEQSLTVLDDQASKLKRLLNQLLDVSRLESRRLTLELQQIDLAQLVSSTSAMMQTLTQHHTIKVNASVEITTLADPDRLEQVLINLLDNAIKYSPDGGSIDVDVRVTDANVASIRVADHGLGIPENRRDKIFERFYQAHGNGHLGGMGLGLYVSQEIVEMHGGMISVEFPSEGGTRFVIQMPIRSPEYFQQAQVS